MINPIEWINIMFGKYGHIMDLLQQEHEEEESRVWLSDPSLNRMALCVHKALVDSNTKFVGFNANVSLINSNHCIVVFHVTTVERYTLLKLSNYLDKARYIAHDISMYVNKVYPEKVRVQLWIKQM